MCEFGHSAMDRSMVSDLSLREIKAAAEPKLETTAGLFVLCVVCLWGGRGSVRKGDSGKELCNEGKVLESYLL